MTCPAAAMATTRLPSFGRISGIRRREFNKFLYSIKYYYFQSNNYENAATDFILPLKSHNA